MIVRAVRWASVLLAVLLAGAVQADCAPFVVTGDAIDTPLVPVIGRVEKGAQIAADRQRGDCVICHELPLPERRFHGNVGPSLVAVGNRLSPGQIRLRVAAPRLLHPQSIMPDYCRVAGRHRVAAPYQDRPILTASEIEHLVAWLATLQKEGGAP